MAAITCRRKLAAALTLIYLVLVGVVPLAHARAEAADTPGAAHLVAFGEDACPPVHDDAHCAACKVVDRLAMPPGSGEGLDLSARLSGVRLFHRVVDLPPSPVAAPPTRAPPLA
ncbi:MAG TPA: hypothetical protein VHG51_01190 [Longimicrobiaceae bacterium]|nr:hypothetical protein [Longimicrobiaceae bacterium]